MLDLSPSSTVPLLHRMDFVRLGPTHACPRTHTGPHYKHRNGGDDSTLSLKEEGVEAAEMSYVVLVCRLSAASDDTFFMHADRGDIEPKLVHLSLAITRPDDGLLRSSLLC